MIHFIPNSKFQTWFCGRIFNKFEIIELSVSRRAVEGGRRRRRRSFPELRRVWRGKTDEKCRKECLLCITHSSHSMGWEKFVIGIWDEATAGSSNLLTSEIIECRCDLCLGHTTKTKLLNFFVFVRIRNELLRRAETYLPTYGFCFVSILVFTQFRS